jgi:hypothetical protein
MGKPSAATGNFCGKGFRLPTWLEYVASECGAEPDGEGSVY